MSSLAPLLPITAPKPSCKGVSAHLLKFLVIYLRRGHLQKYPKPKLKLNLHSRELSSPSAPWPCGQYDC